MKKHYKFEDDYKDLQQMIQQNRKKLKKELAQFSNKDQIDNPKNVIMAMGDKRNNNEDEIIGIEKVKIDKRKKLSQKINEKLTMVYSSN